MNEYFELGPIRPPSESASLLLRITRNCPWNKCEFCSVYKGSKFSIRDVEEIKSDIDIMYGYKKRIIAHKKNDGTLDYEKIVEELYSLHGKEQQCYFSVFNFLINGGGESAFLQDANSVVLKTEKLAEAIRYLKVKFPEITRITSYGRADTISRLSQSQLEELSDAGLNRIHSGYESGSDKVLSLINKGCTKTMEIEAGQKVKAAGIQFSVYYMPGVGGIELSNENAEETADVISQIDPDFIRIRTFVEKDGKQMNQSRSNRKITECTDLEKANELQKFIQCIHHANGTLVSDHAVNLFEEVTGNLNTDREKMLNVFTRFNRLQEDHQRRFQIARRLCMVRQLDDMALLNKEQESEVNNLCRKIPKGPPWEAVIKELVRQYI